MRIIEDDRDYREFIKIIRDRSEDFGIDVLEDSKIIIEHVKKSGDFAVELYTNRYDRFQNNTFKVSQETIEEYAGKTERSFLDALSKSIERIRHFHEKQVERSWKFKDALGVELGQIIRPLERVGVYVPGGKAAYPSSVLMNVIPAQIAGVKEIALCVPFPDGQVNPYVMAAVKAVGVTEVYAIGGAQAIAAMAYGTQTIKKVDKIVGPGNAYVAAAKKMVFGTVDIDIIAGPSEILIAADETAEAAFIAADLLSQAEHDENASSILVTTSRELVGKVQAELTERIEKLSRKEIVQHSLENYGAIIMAADTTEMFDRVNEIAPEHLEIMTKAPERDVELVKNAGAVFLGKWSAEPLGDYSAGPNHVLPTNGTARFFSPLGVYDFIKRTSLINFTEAGFKDIASAVEAMAGYEGLDAHAESVAVRKRALGEI
ncbi:histidinol dehydrogenase [Candidatus Magnetominusculus xianensis]|uniref:Histidinol dehydrogenase n=1 Tax=Candidatus Magnetominusculus xianensis TaxID=1748249 RepID=A0ABR5SEH2_9BACT|nr:histidinol dehydrogenase [Candidatus Magnetominusculus xianensis]KWT84424.1 histidinol dehydrogenase [Candidatus Magnetominusculus xianensis]MBF0404258.1 histidinol dehydrogenase [Nitrospirota bacterium]